MNQVWIVGMQVAGGWMPEGVFADEQAAVRAVVNDDEFVVCVNVGERIAAEAMDAIAMYWPRLEKREDSALSRMRSAS